MATWQFYNETGRVGGTANKQTDKTFYVDPFTGDDANVGSYLAPYNSIQKVLDECASAGNGGAITNVDIIATGYFEEGDFLNRPFGGVSLIAEGRVTIKATTHNGFKLCAASNSWVSFNYDINSGNKKRNFGRITIKDFPQNIYFGAYYSAYIPPVKVGIFNVSFINNQQVGYAEQANFDLLEGCVFDMPSYNTINFIRTSNYRTTFIQKNSFLGSYVYVQSAGLVNLLTYRDNYFDSTTKIYQYDESNYTPSYNNHIVGTLAGKITINNSVYTSRDLAIIGKVTFDINGKSSSASPQFNTVLNSSDLTYAPASPNGNGGYDGKQIGAFGFARGAENTDDANWTIDANATKGTGEIYQSGGTTSIVTNTNGIQFATVDRRIERITIPASIVDYTNGYTIDTVRSADEASPNIETVEIKVSSDDVTYSASWIKVPLEGIPYIDASGVGSGDDAYDHATRSRIVGQYIKYRITLRNNEVILP